MDRAAFLRDLNEYLDARASESQLLGMTRAMRQNTDWAALALAYQLQDRLLEEVFEPLPTFAPAAQLLQRAKKRARIVDFEDPSASPASPAAPPVHAPAPPQKRRGTRGARTGSRGLPPVRGRRSPLTVIAAMTLGAAAVVALCFYLVRKDPAAETPVDVAEKPAPGKKEPGPKKTPAPKEIDPIVSIRGGGHVREGNTLTTDHRSSIEVKLADGSVVELKPGTRVTFASPTDAVRQDLEIAQGRLAVNAAKGDGLFRVRAGGGEVTVLGTRFVVDVPSREHLAVGRPAPARIEVAEGRVRLKNAHGELELAPEQQAILCDAFDPRRIEPACGHAFLKFGGRLHGMVVGKNRQGILLRVLEAKPGRENALPQPKELVHRIFWLHVPGEHDEGEGKRAHLFLKDVRVMEKVGVQVWAKERRFVFGVPKRH